MNARPGEAVLALADGSAVYRVEGNVNVDYARPAAERAAWWHARLLECDGNVHMAPLASLRAAVIRLAGVDAAAFDADLERAIALMEAA